MTLPVKLRQETHTYLACPYQGCEGEHGVGHLLDGQAHSFGPWSCDDCGRVFSGNVTKDGTITLEERPGVKQEGLVLLRGAQTNGQPLYFVVHDRNFFPLEDGETEEDRHAQKHYFYEEHTCPTNYIPIFALVTPDDPDPHGALEFVGVSHLYWPKELDVWSVSDRRDEHVRALFRKLNVPYPGNG